MSPGQFHKLTNCSDVSLSVFAYRTFETFCFAFGEGGDVLLADDSNKAGCKMTDELRAPSSRVGTSADEALCISFLCSSYQHCDCNNRMQLTLGNGALAAFFISGRSTRASTPLGSRRSRRHQRTHDLYS